MLPFEIRAWLRHERRTSTSTSEDARCRRHQLRRRSSCRWRTPPPSISATFRIRSTGDRREPNLPAAQQMIDILSLLEAKTRGNLTAEERQLLEQLLYELRLRYVEATQTAPTAAHHHPLRSTLTHPEALDG